MKLNKLSLAQVDIQTCLGVAQKAIEMVGNASDCFQHQEVKKEILDTIQKAQDYLDIANSYITHLNCDEFYDLDVKRTDPEEYLYESIKNPNKRKKI